MIIAKIVDGKPGTKTTFITYFIFTKQNDYGRKK